MRNERIQQLYKNRITNKEIADHFKCGYSTVAGALATNRYNSFLAQNIRQYKKEMEAQIQTQIQTRRDPVRISAKPMNMPCGELDSFYKKCYHGCHLWKKCPIYIGPPRISGGPVRCKGSSQHNIFQTKQK